MSSLLKGRTILVVEDDADTRDLLRFVLQESGAKVVAVASVDAAFGTYRQSPPHGVIADIRLGRSDGYALIKAIRETDMEYRGFTPAIAVTGFASPDDEDRAMAAGFNAYITKPFDPEQVVTTLAGLLRRSGDMAA